MSEAIVIAVLFAALLHAGWNVFIRSAEDKGFSTLLVAGGAGILVAPWLPFAAPPAFQSWPYLLVSVVIHVFYFSAVARLYAKAEVSFAYPIMRGSAPAASALLALVLMHESPTGTGWLGIVLVSLGVLLLAGEANRSQSLSWAAALLVFANAAIIVSYTLVDGVGARLSGHPSSYTAWLFFLTALPLLALYLGRKGRQGGKELGSNWHKGMVGGACSVASYGVALWAMTRAPIALVAALRETSVVFATLMGAGFLKERVSPLRYLAIAIVTGGAVAIKMS